MESRINWDKYLNFEIEMFNKTSIILLVPQMYMQITISFHFFFFVLDNSFLKCFLKLSAENWTPNSPTHRHYKMCSFLKRYSIWSKWWFMPLFIFQLLVHKKNHFYFNFPKVKFWTSILVILWEEKLCHRWKP